MHEIMKLALITCVYRRIIATSSAPAMLLPRLLVGFLFTAVAQQSLWSFAYTPDHADQCSITSIPDYLVWLNSSLLVVFNTTEYNPNHCSYHIFRDMVNLHIHEERLNSSDDQFAFFLPLVSEEFDNASMTVIAYNSNTGNQYRQNFTIHTVDNVSAVTNLSYSSNCTYTIVWWLPPYSQGLKVTDYYYELRQNCTIVESGVTVDPFVVFNLTALPANKPNYSVSVWARAPPGNGTVTNASIAAAVAPNVSYSTDVAIVSQQAVLILDVKVNPSCPPSYPARVTIWFSCVPDYIPLTRPIHIASNGSTEEIQSDAIDTGHTDCNVTVTSDNRSDMNTSQSFIFSSTDVQLLVASPSEYAGAIYLWMKLARNSNLQEIIVNLTNSRGELVNTSRIRRPPHKREVTMTTSILPVGMYIISVFSCYNKSFIISKTVNITHSNYSSTSIPVFPSTTATSTPTTTPAVPTTNVPVIIGVVLLVICVVMTGSFVGVCILLVKQHRNKRRQSFGDLNSSGSTNYGTGFQDSCQLTNFSADNSESASAPIVHKEKEPQDVDTCVSLDTPPATEDSLPVDKVTATPDAVSKDASAVTSAEPVTAIETPPMNKSEQTASSNALVTPVQVMSMLVLPPLLTTANVVTDDVPPTAIEKQPTPVVNEPKHTASQTTLDKSPLPVSVQATTPNSEDTSIQLLPPPPVNIKSIPSQPSITGMPRRPSQPVLQQTAHSDLKPDQQALAIATSQSRPSLTSSDTHELLPNLQALNIQETAANSPVKFTISESPSPPPSPPAPSQYAQDLSYPTQETTYTTDDSLRPFIKPSPKLSSPSRPKPVHPVPESSTTANSLDQLIKDVPSSDSAEEDEESYLTNMGKEVSKKSKSQPYFVK